MQKRRVVVTGVGLVTALGTGTEETWKGLCEGRSGISKITRFDTTLFSTKIAAEVKEFDPLHWFEKKDVKKMDSFIHYAVAAAEYAMKQSGLTITPELSGVVQLPWLQAPTIGLAPLTRLRATGPSPGEPVLSVSVSPEMLAVTPESPLIVEAPPSPLRSWIVVAVNAPVTASHV